jgi:hypothetical protein
MDKLSYRCHRFPSIVIQQAVWLYFRFALSYRDVEDMLVERGIDVSYDEASHSSACEFCPLETAVAFIFESFGSIPKGFQQLAIGCPMALERRRSCRWLGHNVPVSESWCSCQVSTFR